MPSSALPSALSRTLFPYGSIFIAALVLRLFGIAVQNICYDEHWTLLVASSPVRELPDLLPRAESSKPPFTSP